MNTLQGSVVVSTCCYFRGLRFGFWPSWASVLTWCIYTQAGIHIYEIKFSYLFVLKVLRQGLYVALAVLELFIPLNA